MGRHAGTVGLAFALMFHGAVGAVVWRIPAPALRGRTPAIEIEVHSSPPPRVPEPPAPVVPAPPPTPRAIPRVRPKIIIPPPESAPPPPAEAPPAAERPADPAPPVVGVTPASVIDDPNAVAVPVGNTVEGNPDLSVVSKPKVGSALGVPGGGGKASGATVSGFSPVEDSFLKERPRVLKELQAEYPSEARNLGVGGVVLLRVSVDSRGRVHAVRIVQGVGHGMDEAARSAMLGFQFSPARLPNGDAVDHVITYRFRFDLPY